MVDGLNIYGISIIVLLMRYMFHFHLSFPGFVKSIQGRLFLSSNFYVSHLTVYWDGCNNSNFVRIIKDKDVSWLMYLVLSKFQDNDLLVVVDSVLAGASGSTTYLYNEVPRFQHSHHET